MVFKIRSTHDLIFVLSSLFVLLMTATIAGCLVDEDTLAGQDVIVDEPVTSPIASVTPEVPAPAPEVPAPAPVSIPDKEIPVTYQEAEAAFTDGRYNDAVDLFTSYTSDKSENPWGFYMLALSASRTGQNELAEDAFERTLELDPKHVKSLTNWARLLLNTDRPDEALVRIDQAIALDSASADAYRLKGRAFHQSGQTEDAADAYREAIRIDNKDAWAMNNLGLILIEDGLYDQATTTLARATQIRDDIAIFFNNLGMAFEKTGHFRAAEEAYRNAVSMVADYERAGINMSRVEAVVEDPYLEPVDLDALAQEFVDEIGSWSDEEIARERLLVTDPVEIVENVGSELQSLTDSTAVASPKR